MFAIHYRSDGRVDYVGEVFSQSVDAARIQVCDAILLTGCGLWQLTDEVVEVQNSECRWFLSPTAAADACAMANASMGH